MRNWQTKRCGASIPSRGCTSATAGAPFIPWLKAETRQRKAAIALVVGALMFCTHLVTPLAAEDAALRLEADLPYQADRSDPVEHEVDFAAVVTPPYHCKVLRVWLPLPPSDVAQEVSRSFFSTFPERVELRVEQEPVYGNRFAYFEFHKPQGAQIIRHRFTAKVWTLHWNVEPDKIAAVSQWPASFRSYLKSHPIATEQAFTETLREIGASGESSAARLFGVMDWIDDHLTYDHVDSSLEADPAHAFIKRRGHCSDYHGLCATMGRELGYPTRVTYGLSLFPKNSPSHCKLEAFLPPYGWVSFDLSETQKLMKSIDSDGSLAEAEKVRLIDAVRARLKRGFRENSWLLHTKGTQYVLAPPASRPVHVVRTIYAEADGEPLPEPDPANPNQREFGWMTVHKYTADKPLQFPFKDWSTLDP